MSISSFFPRACPHTTTSHRHPIPLQHLPKLLTQIWLHHWNRRVHISLAHYSLLSFLALACIAAATLTAVQVMTPANPIGSSVRLMKHLRKQVRTYPWELYPIKKKRKHTLGSHSLQIWTGTRPHVQWQRQRWHRWIQQTPCRWYRWRT